MSLFDVINRTKINAAMLNESLEFGPLLRVIRKTLGLQLKVVAEDTGIESQRIRNYEMQRFRREPKKDDILILSRYYGIPYDYLYFKLTARLENMRQVSKAKVADRILPG